MSHDELTGGKRDPRMDTDNKLEDPRDPAKPKYHCPVCCEMPCACAEIVEGQPGSIKRVDCVHCADTGFMPTPCTYCGQHKSLLGSGPTISFRKMKLDGTYEEVARADEAVPDNAWPLDNCPPDEVQDEAPATKPPSPPAPSITDAHVENSIKEERYMRIEGTNVTICCITMVNGFTLIGESHCVSAENFDRRIGNDIARRDATDQIWRLLGYVLKDRLYHAK